MLRVRFDNERVVVTQGGQTEVIISEKYDNVEVELISQKGYWYRLHEPLKSMRMASYVMAALATFSGGTGKGKEG